MTGSDKPIVWTISGADCSGGAGIAADIKTGHSLNVETCHLITANTVQNSQQLYSINPVNTSLLSEQVDALKEDKKPAVIKIGLIATIDQVQWLITTLTALKKENSGLIVVFDPVGSASVGGKLTTLQFAHFRDILPYIDIVTPNLDEAKMLTQSTVNDANLLARRLCQYGANTTIVKGGHSESDKVTDLAYDSLKDQVFRLSSPRVNTHFSHGGGCSFAMAIASYIAQGYLLRDAFTLTKTYIHQGLKAQENKLEQYGAFDQPKTNKLVSVAFPTVESVLNQQYHDLAPFPVIGSSQGEQSLGLYPVVDSVEWLKKLLPLNLEIIQLRLKNLSDEELDAFIMQAVALSKHYKTRLFINDYWQLAIKHGAYGVHIGQEDLLEADLFAISQAGLRLGISTHGCYEFILAKNLKPSYLAIGAIFPTKTKNMTGQIQGINNLSHILTIADNIPVVAIGGINQLNVEEVWKTGVDAVAVVTAITEADDYQQAVTRLQSCLQPS
ncbi:thiamine phosphate synthase [Thalassotalea sp. 1_MG-2023]|uniref:thiamine phosphate synthase n=1 Tax=Thalassotalea sp. 1_MG-2023 TaxID=3062680 RepID=UPI0026E13C5C|nr:thiamine phosphate synthase [Thalassotalea sp. 1_MG-2023]MDO6426047.1 thiamine phosphate synthase [Thalassotalea sp. 1_MG-2023]